MKVCALALALALLGGAAAAADLAPQRSVLDRAAQDGQRIAARHEGYPFGAYVLHEVRDARAIDPADGSVDAVVLATPFERTRHAAYIAAYGDRRIDGGEAFRDSGLPRGSIAVIVFAHGENDDDDSFVGKFGRASLVFEGHPAIEAPPQPSETNGSTYPLASSNRERIVATITYRFDLGGVAGADRRRARLTFVDATGKAFDLPVDFAKVS